MATARRIAFYAPLKPPDHPIPSGDRQMARMLLAALRRAGHDAFLASRVIAYSKRPGAEHLAARKAAAEAEAQRLLSLWRQEGGAPELWFSYHPYDKSPDWLGEIVSRSLAIPMVTAEPCRTGAAGDWQAWRRESERIIASAAMNIVMTKSDFDFVSAFVPPERIAWFDPFIDADLLRSQAPRDSFWPADGGPCRLLAVGMMRPGAKLASYAMLAAALAMIEDAPWSLAIVGGGPGEAEVRALFARFGEGRVSFAGERSPEEVLGLMEQADLLAWPGCREAYGMVYLEAATRGLPAVALAEMGVPRVVEHERTGLLADPPQAARYAAVLARAIGDSGLRERLSRGAREFVAGERSGERAALRLADILAPVFADARA